MTSGIGPSPLPPGSTVRFRVVSDDGAQDGSSWSVQTARETGDVYLAHRDGGRWVHTSLHHDGRWHFAVSKAGQALVPEAPRYLGVSTDHDEIAPGWLHAVRITVAASELRSGWREGARARDLIEVHMPADAEALSIDVLLAGSSPARIRLDRAFLVANMKRGDDGTVVIVARPTSLEAPVRVALASQIAEAVSEMRELGWNGESSTRLVIFGVDADGYLREVEIAVDPNATADDL